MTIILESPTKQCKQISECLSPHGSVMPATTEYFHRKQSCRDGLHPICRWCRNSQRKASYRANPLPQRTASLKYHQAHKEAANARSRQRYADHAIEERDKARQRHRDNRERNLMNMRQWRMDNHDRVLDYGRNYREQRREQFRLSTKAWREGNRERDRANARKWQQAHPLRVKLKNEHYRTRKRNLLETLTATQWEFALEYFGHSCAVCGRAQGLWHTLAIDHWIPLSSPDCPGTTVGNCIPLCHGEGGCNNSKHDLMPDEWLIRLFGLRKAKAILRRINTYFDHVKEN